MCVHASGLQVSPILLELADREQGKTVALSNTGNAVLRAQVRVLSWSQDDSGEQLTPTRELVASPPMVEIAPGANQTVRIVRLSAAPAGGERSYRLIIDEIPAEALPASASASAPKANSGLQFLLRYSVPVFVAAAGQAPPPAGNAPSDLSALSLRVQADAGGLVLHAANGGKRRLRISQLAYVDAAGQRQMLADGLLGYVLAGRQTSWPLRTLLPAAQFAKSLQGGATLRARINDDREEQVLVVERP